MTTSTQACSPACGTRSDETYRSRTGLNLPQKDDGRTPTEEAPPPVAAEVPGSEARQTKCSGCHACCPASSLCKRCTTAWSSRTAAVNCSIRCVISSEDSPEQLTRFLAEAKSERLYAMWVLFATTSMRRSEAVGAHRDAVDLEHLTIDPATAAVLRAHLEQLAAERAEWGTSYQDHGEVVLLGRQPTDPPPTPSPSTSTE